VILLRALPSFTPLTRDCWLRVVSRRRLVGSLVIEPEPVGDETPDRAPVTDQEPYSSHCTFMRMSMAMCSATSETHSG
jgi:hypothetical protein